MMYHTRKSKAWSKWRGAAWGGLNRIAVSTTDTSQENPPARFLVALAGGDGKINEARQAIAS